MRGHAGEQNEGRRAEVRDPAGQKYGWLGEVARLHAAGGEEITRVIKRHQHHDETTQQIDRVDAAARDLSGLGQLTGSRSNVAVEAARHTHTVVPVHIRFETDQDWRRCVPRFGHRPPPER